MSRLLLLTIATIYAILGVWCSVDPVGTAQALGILLVRDDGLSEWIAVYGGMELGFAGWAAWAAWGDADRRSSALAGFTWIHGGIMLARLPTLVALPATTTLPALLATVEVTLTVLCLVALLRLRHQQKTPPR